MLREESRRRFGDQATQQTQVMGAVTAASRYKNAGRLSEEMGWCTRRGRVSEWRARLN